MGKNELSPSMICVRSRGWSTRRLIGFTLIEIILSLAILGILAGIAIPLYAGYIDKARNEAAMADIRTISSALTTFFADNNIYPESLDEVRTISSALTTLFADNYIYPESLAEAGSATYRDPWGNPYQYLNIQTARNRGQMRKDRFLVPINTDYDLYSMGKDGQSRPPLNARVSRDDIIRANDGAYIGPASGF